VFSPRLVASAGILAFLLAAPVTGYGFKIGQPAPQTQGQAAGQTGQAGRGSATAPASPSKPGATQSPTGQGQSGPRQTPNVEQFLQGWDWWNDDAVKKELKLTDMQVRQIQMIFDRRVRELTPTYDEYRKQRAELDRLTLERTVDEGTYAVQVGRTQYLLSKLNETRTVMLYGFYRRLDPKQYEQLRVIRDKRFARGGGPPSPRTW
jgi:Spy/CpxP family protein refolding chaperone